MKTFTNHKGQMIGELKETIFRKRIRGSRHIMKLFDGSLGIDSKVVNDLLNEGCKEVRIKDIETGVIYKTPLKDFIRHGIEKNFDGQQVFCPLRYWEKIDPQQMAIIPESQVLPLDE